MSASSIEVATGVHLDPDRELRAVGIGNLAAALGGGPPGYHSLALTLLAHGIGLTGRANGLIAAVACLLALTVGTPLIGALPTGLFATGIIVIGITFLAGALVDQRRSLPAADYAVMASIPAVTAAFGFLWGVAVGLVAAALFFVVTFARMNVVRLATTGARLRSRLERPDAEQRRLASLGRQVAVYGLDGYLFFGTAHRLVARIAAALDRTPAPRHVVVDFSRVTGLDTSAARALARLDETCRLRGATLHFAALDEPSARLVRARLADPAAVRFPARLEQALQQIETELLAADPAPPDTPGSSTSSAPPPVGQSRRLRRDRSRPRRRRAHRPGRRVGRPAGAALGPAAGRGRDRRRRPGDGGPLPARVAGRRGRPLRRRPPHRVRSSPRRRARSSASTPPRSPACSATIRRCSSTSTA